MRLTYDQPVNRYKWLRRFAMGYALALLLLIGFRFLLAWRVEGQVQGLEQAVRGLGGRWTPVELANRPPLPDAENAMLVFQRAAAMHVNGQDCFRNSAYQSDLYAEKPVLWYYLAAASDERYAPMFKLATSAMKLPYARQPTQPGGNAIGSPLYQARTLANELGDNLQFRHLRGEELIAIERFRTILHLARSMRQEPDVIDQLIALEIDALAFDALMEIAPELRVDDPRVNQEVRSLLRELETQEADLVSSSRNSLWAKLWEARQLNQVLTSRSWLTRPVAERQFVTAGRVTIDDYTNWRTRVRAPQPNRTWLPGGGFAPPTMPAAVSFSYGRKGIALSPPFEIPLNSEDLSDSRRFEEVIRRVQMESRFLRTSLAVRLFVHDRGRFPASLTELVPGYVSSVPVTPGFETNPLQIVRVAGAHRDKTDRVMLVADSATSQNAMPPYLAASWTTYRPDGGRFDELGRQWRDVGRWSSTAYLPAMEASHNQPANTDSYDQGPGFEASGLQPSAHSPAEKPADSYNQAF